MPTNPKPQQDDPAQSERFVETARQLEADESPEAFKRNLKRLAPGKPAPKNPSEPKS